MLKFDDQWRFDSPGAIPEEVNQQFYQLIVKLAKGQQSVFEHFKGTFGSASGSSPSTSSSASWASSDLMGYMSEVAGNAPTYIEASYDGWNSLSANYTAINLNVINRILQQAGTRYQIDGDQLIFDGPQLIQSPKVPESLLDKAKITIEESLKEGDRLLQEGRYRQAVQEILWLLETVITGFDGMEISGQTIQGKYFNKIMESLSKKTDGTTLKQVIEWVKVLHGYLSAPAGGGIRHGVHLANGIATTPNEAWLYYNLSKSYIVYFFGEYEKMKETSRNSDDLLFQ